MRNMVDLRERVFDTIDRLLDEKNPLDIDRANAVSNAAQAIVASCRVECAYLELVGGTGTGFIPDEDDGPDGRLKLVGRN
jgi:hypothetical protein